MTKLKISVSYCIAFFLLLIVTMECHELVHITTGYFICGCWGARDFNVWALCESCRSSESLGWIATLSGPLFSFALMYVGTYLLSGEDQFKRSFGFALIFCNIPFGRITTVMMGGGDEMVVIRHFVTQESYTTKVLIGTVLVFLIIIPPIIKAYRVVSNRLAWLYLIGFLTVPLMFLLTYELGLLNFILSKGFLAQAFVMGTPLFIWMHTLIATVLFLMTRRNLRQEWS